MNDFKNTIFGYPIPSQENTGMNINEIPEALRLDIEMLDLAIQDALQTWINTTGPEAHEAWRKLAHLEHDRDKLRAALAVYVGWLAV